MKARYKVNLVIILMIMAVIGITIRTDAAYYDIQKTDSWNCIWGFEVVRVTLHASGYIESSYGRVTNHWMTVDKCYMPNYIEGEKTWVTEFYNGERAYGSYKLKMGVPSPWGVIGNSGTTHTMYLSFGNGATYRTHGGSSGTF